MFGPPESELLYTPKEVQSQDEPDNGQIITHINPVTKDQKEMAPVTWTTIILRMISWDPDVRLEMTSLQIRFKSNGLFPEHGTTTALCIFVGAQPKSYEMPSNKPQFTRPGIVTPGPIGKLSYG